MPKRGGPEAPQKGLALTGSHPPFFHLGVTGGSQGPQAARGSPELHSYPMWLAGYSEQGILLRFNPSGPATMGPRESTAHEGTDTGVSKAMRPTDYIVGKPRPGGLSFKLTGVMGTP